MAFLKAVSIANGVSELWTKELLIDQPFRLGRLPNLSDWNVNDPMISGYHCTLTWDGNRLIVVLRDPPPVNPLWHNRTQVVGNLELSRHNDNFQIGNTSFILLVDEGVTVDGISKASKSSEDSYFGLYNNRWHEKLAETAESSTSATMAMPYAISYSTSVSVMYDNAVSIVRDMLPLSTHVLIIEVSESHDGSGPKISIVHGKRKLGNLSDKRISHLDSSTCQTYVNCELATQSLSDNKCMHSISIKEEYISDEGLSRTICNWCICAPIGQNSKYLLYVIGSHCSIDEDFEAMKLVNNEYKKIVILAASLLDSYHTIEKSAKVIEQCKKFIPAQLRLNMDEEKINRYLTSGTYNVTVLFCDLRNSCKMAEDNMSDMENFRSVLTDILDEIAFLIESNDGVIAGLQGDAVVAFWGWPNSTEYSNEEHAQVIKAATSALAIRSRFLRPAFTKYRIGIGLSHGQAIAGKLGTYSMAKVDVYGHVVNLASRLESMTKLFDSSILIDENSASILNKHTDNRRWRTKKLVKVQPYGMQKSLLVSELLPHENDIDNPLPEKNRIHWERLIDSFIGGKWSLTQELMKIVPDNSKVSSMIKQYIIENNGTPPENWDGTINLKAK